jgi:dihydrofolate synthase / folylpolyglutamate synthase
MPTSDELIAELKTLHPILIDLSLGRITTLLEKLGNPHRKLPPVVHIAGTNGKGSTTAFLKAMFEAAGKRAHVYTSPHLVRFHERMSLAGIDGKSQPISEPALVELLSRVARINAGAPVTFFEITTAAAFVAFAETPADVLILEVGLGGDFDTTNVVERPALCVITPISMDHADKLGATLDRIAATKAGILKNDVPAVISQQDPIPLDVIRTRARQTRSPLIVWGEDFEAFEQRGRMLFQSENEVHDLPLPALLGRHQIVNAGAAVAAALQLKPLGMTDAAIEKGLTDVRWPGRMQRLTNVMWTAKLPAGSEVWLDGGHNPAGGVAIAQTFADLEEKSPKPLVLITGMMGLKDAGGFLAAFCGLTSRVVAVPIPGAHEKPHDPADLASIATAQGFKATAADSVATALTTLASEYKSPARVLICGSLYLAGHVLALDSGVKQQSN